jgi:hypothetical protein
MKSAWKIILILILSLSLQSRAQPGKAQSGLAQRGDVRRGDAQRGNAPNRFELEADPIAFILNGYSFHVGYTMGHIRLDAGVFGIRQPDFALQNKLFSVFSSGAGIKADYLLRKNRGLFFGLQSDYGTDKIGLKSHENTRSVSGATVGLRTGYRFMFGKKANQYKGLYLVPWIALINSPNPHVIRDNGHEYAQPRWSVFPTVHLGYRF